jgi:thiamine-monophosphate kinase
VAIAGEIGRAARGLRILFERFTDATGAPIPLDERVLSPAERGDLAAQLRPTPPVSLGPLAAEGGATAMMDVSDGLVLDATRLATASGVTVALHSSELGPDVEAALTGGEDHALLATFPAGHALPSGFRRVGEVVAAGDAPVLVDGVAHRKRGGWDPYRDWDARTG